MGAVKAQRLAGRLGNDHALLFFAGTRKVAVEELGSPEPGGIWGALPPLPPGGVGLALPPPPHGPLMATVRHIGHTHIGNLDSRGSHQYLAASFI